MNIGIIGCGELARILGTAWAADRHHIVFGADHDTPNDSAAAEQISNATRGSCEGAAAFGEVVVLATPWRVTLTTILPPIRERLAGKTLVDTTNPVNAAGELESCGESSFAEQVATQLPSTDVVKAANAISPETLRYVLSKGRPYINGQPITAFYCGDNSNGKRVAAGLIGELSLEPVDVGDLRMARLLEPLGVFAQQLSQNGTLGTAVAINAVHELRDHSPLDNLM